MSRRRLTSWPSGSGGSTRGTARNIEASFHETIAHHGIALGKLAQPVRAAVTGSTTSPGIYEVLDVLGRERALARLHAARARIPSVSAPSAP
jgi:glutamyl-tRNA synthetase